MIKIEKNGQLINYKINLEYQQIIIINIMEVFKIIINKDQVYLFIEIIIKHKMKN